jgi:hypothetical protein
MRSAFTLRIIMHCNDFVNPAPAPKFCSTFYFPSEPPRLLTGLSQFRRVSIRLTNRLSHRVQDFMSLVLTLVVVLSVLLTVIPGEQEARGALPRVT